MGHRDDAPSGPLASALVAFVLPGTIDGQGLQATLRDKYSVDRNSVRTELTRATFLSLAARKYLTGFASASTSGC